MARKSRKNMMPQAAVQEAVQQNEKELLRTAAYARLSVENGGHVRRRKAGKRHDARQQSGFCPFHIEKKKILSEKLAALQDSIRTEKEEQECADELDEEIRALTKQASEKTYIGGLTKECVDAFVSMVYLYDDQTMKIEFNCEDVIRRALEKYGA